MLCRFYRSFDPKTRETKGPAVNQNCSFFAVRHFSLDLASPDLWVLLLFLESKT